MSKPIIRTPRRRTCRSTRRSRGPIAPSAGIPNFQLSYNVRPTDPVAIVAGSEAGRELVSMFAYDVV